MRLLWQLLLLLHVIPYGVMALFSFLIAGDGGGRLMVLFSAAGLLEILVILSLLGLAFGWATASLGLLAGLVGLVEWLIVVAHSPTLPTGISSLSQARPLVAALLMLSLFLLEGWPDRRSRLIHLGLLAGAFLILNHDVILAALAVVASLATMATMLVRSCASGRPPLNAIVTATFAELGVRLLTLPLVALSFRTPVRTFSDTLLNPGLWFLMVVWTFQMLLLVASLHDHIESTTRPTRGT